MEIGEVVKYTAQNTSTSNSTAQFVVMNKDTWNSLSPDIQSIIEKVNEEYIPKMGALWGRTR